MYRKFKLCGCTEDIAKIIISWMFEYFTGCHKMIILKDGSEKRSLDILQNILRQEGKQNLGALCDLLYVIRNSVAHTPFIAVGDIKNDLISNVLKYSNQETIQQFCSVFEEDAKEFELIYKDVMKTLGLYKDENATSRNDKGHPFDEPLEPIDSGF